METIFRDYSPKGVQFVYLYKALAHPELNGYVNPATLDERLMHVAEAKRTLGSEIPWIADAMDNRLKHAIGDRPNSEYLLDPDGKILSAREWSDPAALRKDLAEHVGPVENPTQASDLDLKVQPPPEHAPTGVVPRIEKPGFYRTITATPLLDKTDEPLYTKLRAEADRGLLQEGKGKLYLAFLLDPLHGVHWNNEAPAMDVELIPAAGVEVSPSRLKGPDVDEPADADPREFLVDVDRNAADEPLGLKFRYFACTDKFCKPVTQEYSIAWQVDRDAGRVMSRRMDFSRMPAGRGGMVDRLLSMDADGDGLLTAEELPEPMRARFDRMDADSDGYLDPKEIEAMAARRPGGPGGGPGGRGPGGPGGLGRFDADGDRRLSRDEAPPFLEERFDRMDANQDGYLTPDEMRNGGRRR